MSLRHGRGHPGLTGLGLLVSGLCLVLPVQAAQTGTSAPELAPIDLSHFIVTSQAAQSVEFHGLVDRDQGGGQAGSMLYPAPGLIGLVAAIATHGALAEANKRSERQKLQAAADEVLLPYQQALADLRTGDVMGPAVARVTAAGLHGRWADVPGTTDSATDPGADAGWIIDSVPQFRLNSDQSALILENAVQVSRADQPGVVRYQNVIRVVSEPRSVGQDAASNWVQLKNDSIGLIAHSLQVLVRELGTDRRETPEVAKTARYLEGQVLRTERGQLLNEGCGRMVIKTLRGWLMSVPLRPDPAASPGKACQDSALTTS